jgi:hypothetical protein
VTQMEALGTVFLVLLAVAALLVLAFVITALPDLSRYRRLRRM